MTEFNKTEQEAIILNAVWRMIDDMVNYTMFVKGERTKDIALMFNTATHQRLFNILLVDFLSQPRGSGKTLPFDLPKPPQKAKPTDYTYLFYLRQVCKDAKLGTNPSLISGPLEAFSDWLEGEALVENVWLPSVNIELNVRVRRIEFIKICGDIAKHNFARLEANVKKISVILANNHHPIKEGEGYLALSEFYDWFHTGLINYHASTIAEFLNNLRWAIFAYLQPEYERSFQNVDPEPMYIFRYPSEITQPIARSMYWDLMNMARSRPFFPIFNTDNSLKLRF